MPTLKEIKGRVGSVQSTLKITSAMKLVASSKLRRAQNAIEAMRPYEAQLRHMLATASGALSAIPGGASVSPSATETGEGPACANGADFAHGSPENGLWCAKEVGFAHGATAIVAFASNSSLCGAFNANAVRTVLQVLQDTPGEVTVFSVGRKMADAMRKTGHPSPQNFTAVAEHPAYAPMSALADSLMEAFAEGRFSRVLLVYNHFVSTARQVPVVEQFLPVAGDTPGYSALDPPSVMPNVSPGGALPDVIIEPSPRELLAVLLPKTLKLKLFAALLDSAAAEHAARTVAMQMATDNGNDLLQELVLQYNKSRQQKITAEILDLAGGQQD